MNTIKEIHAHNTQCNIAFHYNQDERPVEGQIAYFTVYKSVEYVAWGEEGCQIPYTEDEALFTIPFIFTQDTLNLMIEGQMSKLLELMEDHELFVGVETHFEQMKD